jgi:hypothetical protein
MRGEGIEERGEDLGKTREGSWWVYPGELGLAVLGDKSTLGSEERRNL